MYIKGFCHTNLDDYNREVWPTKFVCLPREGDCVESKSGKILKICRITHTTQAINFRGPEDGTMPVINIELHKTV